MFLPVMLNLKKKRIVIVGGGRVAYRKAVSLLEYGASLQIISAEFIEEFYTLGEKVKLIKEYYNHTYIKEADLVVAATSCEDINNEILQFCSSNKILCNCASDGTNSDFLIPSSLKRGDLTIAVSTGGKSPALTAKIRRELEERYTEEYEEYIKLLGEIRSLVLEKCSEEAVKKEILRDIINMSIKELKERREFYEGCHRITGKQACLDTD